MTSKEALEEIIDYIKYKRKNEHIPFFIKLDIDDINKDLDKLEKLEERETPKKVIWGVDKQNRKTMNCPKCNQVFITFYNEVESVRHIKYCYECGQRIDWSDENDK